MPRRVNHRTLVRTLLAVVVVAGSGAAHSHTEAPQWGHRAHAGMGGSGAMPMMAPMGVPGMGSMPMMAPMGMAGMGPMTMWGHMGMGGSGAMHAMPRHGVHHMAMHGDADEHGDQDMPHRRGHHHGRGKDLMHALWMLDLTAEQHAEVRRIRHDLKKRRWELEGPMIDARARLHELYAVDEWDVTAIGEAYGALFDLRRQRIEASLEAYNRALALLTEEQRGQLRQWRERHGGRAKGEHEASRPRYGAGHRMHRYEPGSMHGHGGGMKPRPGGTGSTQP